MIQFVSRKRRASKVKTSSSGHRHADAQTRHAPPTPYKMARGDFWALVINAVFGLLGLLLLPSDPSVGIVTTALFGSGAVFLGLLHWQRYQECKLQLTQVEVAGGVRILPRRGFLLVTGAWLAILGLILVVFGGSYPTLMQWLGAFIALTGTTLLILTLLRVWPAGFLQFEPQGLIIGQRGWHLMVPWDWITDVQEAVYQNNPMVLLTVINVEQLDVTPAAVMPKAQKAMAGSSWWSWGPFAILARHYGIPAPVLAEAIKRYVSDVAARQTLGERKLAAPETEQSAP